MTWSKGMSLTSGILILSYRLKEVINSCVLHCFWTSKNVHISDFELQAKRGDKFLHCFWTSKNVHISATRCLIEMGFGSKCSILNGQLIYIEIEYCWHVTHSPRSCHIYSLQIRPTALYLFFLFSHFAPNLNFLYRK